MATLPYWNNDEVISSDKLNSMVQAIINGDPLAVKVSNATKNDVNQIVSYLSSLHDSAKTNLNSATSTSDFDTAYTNMTALVSNKLGSYANDDTVDLYSTGIRASIIAFLQAYDTMMSNDRLNNKNTNNTLNSRIDNETQARSDADTSINNSLNVIKANGGGRNLLRASSFNSDTKTFNTYWQCGSNATWAFSDDKPITSADSRSLQFTPKSNLWNTNNGIWYTNPQVKAGEIYTFSFWGKSTSDGFKMTAEGKDPQFSTFTLSTSWQYYSGQLKFSTDNQNLYFHANGGNAGTVTIFQPTLEKGIVAHDWQPAPEDTDAKITDLDDKTMQNRGTANAPDFNSLTQAGYYTITNPDQGQNYPTTNWGTLEVSGQVANINGRLNQKYVSDSRGTIYTRQYNAGTKVWTAWVQMANTNDVDAKIDNLQIGGRNLLIGSKTMHDVWVADGVSMSNVDDYLALSATGTNMRIYRNPSEDATGKLMSVSFDAEVPTDSSSQSVQIWVGPYQNGIGVTISGNAFKRYKAENWEWNSVNTAFSIQFKNANDKINIKNIKLEFGNKATDWSPAPEDTDNYTSGRTIALPNNSSITVKGDRIIPRIYLPTYITDYLPNTELNALATMGEYDNLFVPSATMATLTNRPTNPDTNAPLTGDCFFSNHFAQSGNTTRAFQKFYSCDYNYIFIRSYNGSSNSWTNWSCLTPYA